MIHLRFDMIAAHYAGVEGHPQKVMRDLGITYIHATPHSIADQWWFWGCSVEENTPLPEHLSHLDINPEDCVGFGLSPEDVKKIIGGK